MADAGDDLVAAWVIERSRDQREGHRYDNRRQEPEPGRAGLRAATAPAANARTSIFASSPMSKMPERSE